MWARRRNTPRGWPRSGPTTLKSRAPRRGSADADSREPRRVATPTTRPVVEEGEDHPAAVGPATSDAATVKSPDRCPESNITRLNFSHSNRSCIVRPSSSFEPSHELPGCRWPCWPTCRGRKFEWGSWTEAVSSSRKGRRSSSPLRTCSERRSGSPPPITRCPTNIDPAIPSCWTTACSASRWRRWWAGTWCCRVGMGGDLKDPEGDRSPRDAVVHPGHHRQGP